MLFGKLPARKTDRAHGLIEASGAEVRFLIACLPKAITEGPSAVGPPGAETGFARYGFKLRDRLS
jgi:hypothetical protein